MESSDQLGFKHSQHSHLRQKQSDITDSVICNVKKFGEETKSKNSSVYTDQDHRIICGHDGNLISVMDNQKNKSCQLSEFTKEKETSLLKKVNENNDRAMCKLAEFYLYGDLGKKDVKKAYEFFEKAAEKNSSHAMCRIFQMYQSGHLGPFKQDIADARLKTAAEKKNFYALGLIGQRLLEKYLKTSHADSNTSEHIRLKDEILCSLEKAAENNGSRAIYALGEIYEKGLLGEKDLPKAIDFHIKASKIGNSASLKSLYQMTLSGEYSSEKFEKFLDDISFTTTNIHQAFLQGQYQLDGNLGSNPFRGLKWIQSAALKDYDKAIRALAKCYRDGTKCEENLILSQYWFNKLFELYQDNEKDGNNLSRWNLGKLYLNGTIGDIDLENAELCFKKCVEISSDPDQLYELGMLYIRGRLGDKTMNTGFQLIAESIKIWQLEAESNAYKYYDLGNSYYHIHDHKAAVSWLSKASDSDVKAQLLLAKIYFDNILDNSPDQNISSGLKILESLILDHDVSPSIAFNSVNFPINDQTESWLQGLIKNSAKSIPNESSSRRIFREFVITTLARIYEKGTLNGIKYDQIGKCYHQLFVDFENIEAARKLVWLYINQNLPENIKIKVKEFILKIPSLLESNKSRWDDFVDYVLILSKLYKSGDVLPCNVLEATKWLYLALYIYKNDRDVLEHIKHDLKNLPPLDYDSRVQILTELSEMIENLKTISSLQYKELSRILGEIFYDNEIINQNIDKSIHWYTESAEKNNNLASFALAKIYQDDKLDIDKAIKWYMLSLQQGNEEALDILSKIVNEQNENKLLISFLKKYQHQSKVDESELVDVKPLKNLDSYPKTVQEMYELGKKYLSSGKKVDILNAAFWFRKAMNNGHIGAAVKLHFLYNSGLLGIYVVPCAKVLLSDIIYKCYCQLKEISVKECLNKSKVISLLNDILLFSEIYDLTTLEEEVKILMNKTSVINIKHLNNIFARLKEIIRSLYSEISISHDVDVYLKSNNNV